MRSSLRLLREDVAREVVSLRVLLPVDEMLGRRDLQRIGNDARAAMGSGPQPDDLWSERHEPVVAIVRDVIECDMYGHGCILHRAPVRDCAPILRQKSGSAAPSGCAHTAVTHFFERRFSALVFLGRAHPQTMKTDWTSYPSPGFHDELVGPGGGARAAGRQLMRYLTDMDGDEIAVRQQAAELAIKAMGITFTVYHEQDGSIDRAWPLDIIPAHHLPQGMAEDRGGADPARRRAESLHQRRLPRAEIHQGRPHAGLDHRDVEELPRRRARHQTTARHLGAHLRLGPDPRQGRHGLRARRQPARTLRRVLHAREPPGRQTRVSGAVRERRHPAGGRLSLAALRHAERA